MYLVRAASLRLGVAAAVAAAMAVPLMLSAQPAGAAVLTIKPTAKTLTIAMRGNGHAHGLSQYGAQGAALSGMSYKAILKFYYAGTTLTTLPASNIRVKLTGAGTKALTVLADARLSVTGVGALPNTGIGKYRLIAGADNTLTLQRHTTLWATVKAGLPSGTAFSTGSGHSVRVFTTDGGSTRFWGTVAAVRNGKSLIAVNTLALDLYTRGVAPREMPASWDASAVAAQAVAARTYGRYAVEHPQSTDYDICDSTMCQVYGGFIRYSPSNDRLYTDDPAAIVGNNNQVLQYKGQTIFSQFSASNGGWSVSGGQPYMTAHSDPYDAADGSDPYTLQTMTMPVATLAHDFGLKTLTSVVITQRDGHGMWNGRVLAGYVAGATSAGVAKQVAFTGFDLEAALGVGTTWIHFTGAK